VCMGGGVGVGGGGGGDESAGVWEGAGALLCLSLRFGLRRPFIPSWQTHGTQSSVPMG
jgi:hypothetical protein